MRTTRCGNWNSPERSVGQLVVVEVDVALVEVELGRILVEGVVATDVTATLDMWVLLAGTVTLLGADAVDVTGGEADWLHDGQGLEALEVCVVLEAVDWLHDGQTLEV